MMKRLRDMPDMDTVYATPHDHMLYGRGHGERVDATIALGNKYGPYGSVTDLSCGNAAIAKGIVHSGCTVLGDYAPGYEYVGPIEETIERVTHSGLFICSETIEHLDDPGAVLAAIQKKTFTLLLSTPIDNFEDTNAEHVWAWTREDVESLLAAARFEIMEFDSVDSRVYGEPYHYGIWMCGAKLW